MRSTNIRGRNVAFYPGTKISPFGGLPNANREIGVPGKNPEQRKAINVQSDLCATRSGTRKITIYKSQVTIHRFTNHKSPVTNHGGPHGTRCSSTNASNDQPAARATKCI